MPAMVKHSHILASSTPPESSWTIAPTFSRGCKLIPCPSLLRGHRCQHLRLLLPCHHQHLPRLPQQKMAAHSCFVFVAQVSVLQKLVISQTHTSTVLLYPHTCRCGSDVAVKSESGTTLRAIRRE